MSENPPETLVSDPVVAPTAPQEPTPEALTPPSTSEPVEVPPVAPESPREAESAVPVNNDNVQIEPVEPETPAPEQIPLEPENAVSNGTGGQEQAPPQPSPEAMADTAEPATAHMPANEPLVSRDSRMSWLAKAQEMIQFRKRRKLEKIMSMFLKQAEITNDQVEKLLHVSDATATRYLEQLEKEGKIQQSGKIGKAVFYSKT